MNCKTESVVFSSPIGKMLMEYCRVGLHQVKQVEFTSDELFKPNRR